jgi:hypothetical protein
MRWVSCKLFVLLILFGLFSSGCATLNSLKSFRAAPRTVEIIVAKQSPPAYEYFWKVDAMGARTDQDVWVPVNETSGPAFSNSEKKQQTAELQQVRPFYSSLQDPAPIIETVFKRALESVAKPGSFFHLAEAGQIVAARPWAESDRAIGGPMRAGHLIYELPSTAGAEGADAYLVIEVEYIGLERTGVCKGIDAVGSLVSAIFKPIESKGWAAVVVCDVSLMEATSKQVIYSWERTVSEEAIWAPLKEIVAEKRGLFAEAIVKSICNIARTVALNLIAGDFTSGGRCMDKAEAEKLAKELLKTSP